MTQQLLLVDDDPVVTQALETYLKFEGFSCRIAHSGHEALSILNSVSEPPAAILLDLILPVLGGEELLHIISKDPIWKDIPVVVITGMDKIPAKSSPRHVLRKPVNLDNLVAILRRYCLRAS